MTKHKKPEDRINEILDAAACEIEKRGYAALTMDAIVDSAGLSKGSIYRFFKNKKEIALALFERVHDRFHESDFRDVLRNDLSMIDTLVNLCIGKRYKEHDFMSNYRIWLHLLPQCIHDKDFRRLKRRFRRRIEKEMPSIVRLLADNEGMKLTQAGEEQLSHAISVGYLLGEGMLVEELAGTPREGQTDIIHWFIERLIGDALESSTVEK